jgi:glycerol-3-phosphate acyltransferase PlsY
MRELLYLEIGMSTLFFIVMIIVGYLMGSICSAIITSQLFGLPDPRKEGSKNPGATNVLRLAGKKYAVIVLLGDMLKGLVPVLIGQALGANNNLLGFIALAAVLGHMFPIFFGFKGGKGVATALGALFGINFLLGVFCAATWLTVLAFMQYSSLSSIFAISLAPVYSIIVLKNSQAFMPLLMITIMVLFKHRENITRLTKGTEPKVHIKKSVLQDLFSGMDKTTSHPGAETPPHVKEDSDKK